MKKMLAAVLAVATCAATAQAQEGAKPTLAAARPQQTPVITLEEAVLAAGGSAPANAAAAAGIEAARAERTVAGLRPNPVVQGQVENIAGSGPYNGFGAAETTFGVALPIELGGKRGARIVAANAQVWRARLQAAITAADVRAQISQLYIEAVAAEWRLEPARDQARVAAEGVRAAGLRLQAGRAAPLEQQRAEVARLGADANVARLTRLAGAARTNLARRIGRPIDGALDRSLLDRLPAEISGPPALPQAAGTLALAAADADLAVADAGVRLVRANQVPDINVGPAVRRLEISNDTAAVLAVSIPIRLFNSGRAAVAQATAERTRVAAARAVAALDVEQTITEAEAEAANAAITARLAGGPELAAAGESVRVARLAYGEGKVGQLDLLDAERAYAEMHAAAIDALATYQIARIRLKRLTAAAPDPQGN
jgi:cobalt-zinc-cadmium efflux system outer membrane protein